MYDLETLKEAAYILYNAEPMEFHKIVSFVVELTNGNDIENITSPTNLWTQNDVAAFYNNKIEEAVLNNILSSLDRNNNNTKEAPLVCLVGESGVGKTSIATMLEEQYGLKSVESYATRAPRYNGEKGHTFITEEEFKNLKDVVSTTHFAGYNYCVTKDMLDNADVFVVDVPGVKCLREKYTDRPTLVIHLNADEAYRYKRMTDRGDDLKHVMDRIYHDRIAFRDIEQYRNIIVNAEVTKDEVVDAVWRAVSNFKEYKLEFSKWQNTQNIYWDYDYDSRRYINV